RGAVQPLNQGREPAAHLGGGRALQRLPEERFGDLGQRSQLGGRALADGEGVVIELADQAPDARRVHRRIGAEGRLQGGERLARGGGQGPGGLVGGDRIGPAQGGPRLVARAVGQVRRGQAAVAQPTGQVPDQGRRVRAARGEPPAVRRERQRQGRRLVP